MNTENYDKRMKIVNGICGNRYTPLYFSHMQYLKGDGSAGAVLAFLLNLLRMKDENPKDKAQLIKHNMWFCCPAKDIQEQYNMGEDRQRTAIKTLVNTGLIKTQKRKGNILWIRMQYKQLKIASSKPETGNPRNCQPETGNPRNRNGEPPDLETGNPRNLYIAKQLAKQNTKENSRSQAPDGVISSTKGLVHDVNITKSDLFVKQLHAAVSKAGKWLPKTTKGWSGHFDKLVKDLTDPSSGGPAAARDRVQKALDWYVKFINDKYTPKAYCGKTFKEKFIQIEEAMNRTGHGKPKDATGFSNEEVLPEHERW